MDIKVTENNPITISMRDDNGVDIVKGSILEIQFKSNLKDITAPNYYVVEDLLHAIGKLYSIEKSGEFSVLVVSKDKSAHLSLDSTKDFIKNFYPQLLK